MDRSKIDQIKSALRKGKLVYADRGVGKTTAIAELMVESPHFLCVVPNVAGRDALETYIRRITPFNVHPQREYEKLYGHRIKVGNLSLNFTYPMTSLIIVDELDANQYDGGYYAAVTSINKSVVVIE